MKVRLLLVLAIMLTMTACDASPAQVATKECAAWAQDVSPAGQVRWQVLLASGPEEDLGPAPGALAVGGVGVFAETDVVHGLRLASGQTLWTYSDKLWVDGMWRWQHLVVVLSGQPAGGPNVPGQTRNGRLTGLDAATGAVRWTLPMSGIGPQAAGVTTADGGLAVDGGSGQLVMVNMADGTVRWSRAVPVSAGLAAAAGLVLDGSGDTNTLTAYDDRTGVPRWTVASMDMDVPQMQLAAGQLLVSADWGGSPVTAYAPATGRVAWVFPAPAPAGAAGSWAGVAAGTAGVAVAVANPPDPSLLYLLDPATGQVRWQAAALVGAGPLVTADGVVDVEGTVANGPVKIVDRDAADGRIRWQNTLPEPSSDAGQSTEQLVQAGQLALVQSNANPGQIAMLSAYRLDDGSRAWQVMLPENAANPPDPVAGQGVLIEPDTPLIGANMPGSPCGPAPA